MIITVNRNIYTCAFAYVINIVCLLVYFLTTRNQEIYNIRNENVFISLIFSRILSLCYSAWKIAWHRIIRNPVIAPRERSWRPSKPSAWSLASTIPVVRIWRSVAPTIAASRACIPSVWTVETVSVTAQSLSCDSFLICILQANFHIINENYKAARVLRNKVSKKYDTDAILLFFNFQVDLAYVIWFNYKKY